METNYREINYLGQPIQVLQYLSESNNQFEKKIEYIRKLEKKEIAWREANRLSKLWHCIKYKRCRYAPEVYHRVMSFDIINHTPKNH
jgi:hypothetical protein